MSALSLGYEKRNALKMRELCFLTIRSIEMIEEYLRNSLLEKSYRKVSQVKLESVDIERI